MQNFRLYPCKGVLSTMTSGRPVTIDEAVDLKLLLFGNLEDSFGVAWTKQSFYFHTVPPFGFIQKKPGPCGVLAAVQAYVIYELFFGPENSNLEKLRLAQKSEALSRAIAKILWKAGDYQSAIVCEKRKNIVLDTDTSQAILKRDGMMEHLYIHYFECQSCLIEYLCNNISQEIINLILIGKAVPNLFNGNIELYSGGSETTLHHGIPKPSEIGLLSLFDYNDTSPVGSYFKEPIYPIWLILGECHFTVLYAKKKDTDSNCVTLYHYDGMAKIHAETAYRIKPFERNSVPEKDSNLSVVERCIYTRWPLAFIEIVDKNSNTLQDFH